MDQEVAKTLGELELKLQELERELTSLGSHESHAEPVNVSGMSGRLVDEIVERDRDAQEHTAEEAVADGDGFGGPAVWGGEEVPAQAGATIERDWTVEVRETAYGEIPTPLSAPSAPSASSGLSASTPPSAFSTPSTPSGFSASTPPSTPSFPSAPPAHSAPTPPSAFSPPTPPDASRPPHTPPAPAPHEPPVRSDPSPPAPAAPTYPPVSYPPSPSLPAPATEHHAIDVAELVRFEEKLRRTMEDLIDEYSRLLSVDPPSHPRPDA